MSVTISIRSDKPDDCEATAQTVEFLLEHFSFMTINKLTQAPNYTMWEMQLVVTNVRRRAPTTDELLRVYKNFLWRAYTCFIDLKAMGLDARGFRVKSSVGEDTWAKLNFWTEKIK